jgi:hypothetical protein
MDHADLETALADPIACHVEAIIAHLGEDVGRPGLAQTPRRFAAAMRFLAGGYAGDGDRRGHPARSGPSTGSCNATARTTRWTACRRAEEYDPATGRLLGNFPQAFSHVALVNSALNLCGREKPAVQRAEKRAA